MNQEWFIIIIAFGQFCIGWALGFWCGRIYEHRKATKMDTTRIGLIDKEDK